VIDVLFLSVVIIAEQIATAYHKDQIILDEQVESVLELETEEFIVVQQIEAAQLVSTQQQYLIIV
jgi:hypothetical protein